MSSIPAIWRLMWALHAIESGRLKLSKEGSGLAHASSEAFRRQYGRSVDEIIEDHEEYVKRVEAEQALLPIVIPVTCVDVVE